MQTDRLYLLQKHIRVSTIQTITVSKGGFPLVRLATGTRTEHDKANKEVFDSIQREVKSSCGKAKISNYTCPLDNFPIPLRNGQVEIHLKTMKQLLKETSYIVSLFVDKPFFSGS